MKLRAGALILGSLFWDNADRQHWREQRLEIAAARRVRLPIRYGRLSGTRGDTHTMVLSNLCYAHRELGEAFVVPCMRPIQTASDLITEAAELANAEGLGKKWTWGAVGVLANPTSKVPDEILAGWEDFAAEKLRNCDLFTHHTKSERPILSKSGLLQLRWPRSVDTSKPVDLEILLATPTAPTLVGGRYPRPREIGETYAGQSQPEYFVNNVRHHIRTAHDKDIWKNSLRLRPEWVNQYADIGVALGLAQREP